MTAARLDGLRSWHADWSGLRVAVLGAGVSGFAAADTLAELGASVLVIADTVTDERAAMLEVIGARRGTDADLAPFDPELVVVSPGFRHDDPMLVWAATEDVAVWGDVELAWRVRDKVAPAEWICITGTNGKTTTTRLTATMLVAGGVRAAPCGNIGVPVLDAVRDPAGFEVLVVELSSFQLHWLNRTPEDAITPYSSVVLNVADDHLDWHGGPVAYRAAKGRIHTGTRVACVYNLADPVTRELVEEAEVTEGARAIGFGLGVPGPSDLGIVDGILADRAFLDDRRNSALELGTLDDLAASGLAAPHLAADVLAAAALARSYGVTPEAVRAGIRAFRLDDHRIQPVGEIGGAVFVDDSKATNPHAADASLSAYRDVVWIVGGLLKGVDLSPLVERHAGRLRAAVVIGVDRSDVVAAFARHAPGLPLFEVVHGETDDVMAEAVRLAAAVAREGDTVLLAPAAASMDQFRDYAERGARFAGAVRDHAGAAEHQEDADDDAPTGPPAD
jgi:UDP-N-acetylmuramoylalanine--D-glutamate ligase